MLLRAGALAVRLAEEESIVNRGRCGLKRGRDLTVVTVTSLTSNRALFREFERTHCWLLDSHSAQYAILEEVRRCRRK